MMLTNSVNGCWRIFLTTIKPATGFYGTKGLGKNEVRLAYVLNLDAINAAMDCLEKALEEYPGRVKNIVAAVAMEK